MHSVHFPLQSPCNFLPSSPFAIGIQSIQHEINFWNEKSRNASAKSDKEAANVFSMAIDKLNQLLRLMK